MFDALYVANQDVVTFYAPADGLIHVEIRVPKGQEELTTANVLDLVVDHQARDQDGVLATPGKLAGPALHFEESDLAVTVLHGDGSRIELYAPQGGTWLRDDGANECTGGFAVKTATEEGIMSAGHCSGLNQLAEIQGGPVWGMTFRDQSWFEGGDAEWYTTTGNEVDNFHAGPIELRDVTGVRGTSTMPNNAVCAYGRASNFRSCNHTVEAVFVNVNSGGEPVGDLARATNDSGASGDSGGPWFMGNVAWGILHGGDTCAGCTKVYFTTAHEAADQIGVTIQTQ